ncbi:DUF924 family protein [Chelativorans intermedius]|uniref:DUF924 family protein n=1 Tax=Chelativorans intermedius TaxID=515947 RepID=A0ABV6D6U8_9HYPH|nr:DUF924 family protein [Chelativorans intermedius]MCT8998191.1 DUF924 domain-containing protein [Chelativorans intermedius]
MANDWIDGILSFWFEEIGPKGWFSGGEALDRTIRQRFLALYERLSAELPKEAAEDAHAALATVILFDQFPRNMFRGTARAFATDDLAMRIAREAIDRRLDEKLSKEERQFLYMPFQHSEVLADQEHAVMLFKSLGDEESLRYAVEHRDIVQRFGRFPHRNRALGRASTREEEAFLEDHKGFGQ